ncbi:MAG: hypothetical protein KJ726_07325 [Verrucomicrobia bacterium]|nr:hypothetical protein [Verrucomicrobiota bacterium]MBU1909838.1 hypothetical protein [Verrucomicrobiota bacterium]
MNDFLQALQETSIRVSSMEVVLQLALLALAMVFRAFRIGMLAAYLFSLRWGWQFFETRLGSDDLVFRYGYLLCGGTILVLGIIGMLHQRGEG